MILDPAEVRASLRQGLWPRSTAGLAPGFVQCNLVVLPAVHADEFEEFCARNPGPCPLVERLPAGSYAPASAAASDLRTDLGVYKVWRDGDLVSEETDVLRLWRADLVAFLLGCSFSMDSALQAGGVPLRHLEQQRHIPAYISSIQCAPVGPFRGTQVLSMRPIPRIRVGKADFISAQHPIAHGAPVHTGDPGAVGIPDLSKPDFGDPPMLEPGDVPMFWSCGITPQVVCRSARPDLMLTHARGRMFVTDIPLEGANQLVATRIRR
jgi:uncharacterized protein YcsI (UPF0317 family)